MDIPRDTIRTGKGGTIPLGDELSPVPSGCGYCTGFVKCSNLLKPNISWVNASKYSIKG